MVIPPSRSGRRSNGGIIYSTVLNRTPLPALTFTSSPPTEVSPLSCFRRLLAKFSDGSVVSGASPSSSVVLQSKSCADPLPLSASIHPFFLLSFFFFPLRSAIVDFARAKNLLCGDAIASLPPSLSPQRLQTTSRWLDELTTIVLETIQFSLDRAKPELAALSVRKLCFPHGRSIFALPRIAFRYAPRSRSRASPSR